MGVGASIVLFAPDAPSAVAAAKAAQARVEQIEAVLSDYRAQSEVSLLPARLRETPEVQIDPVLADAAESAQKLRLQTDGAFDERLGELTKLWREARKAGVPPDPKATADAWRRSRADYIIQDANGPTPTLSSLSAIRFDFGGIGKGLACDKAAEVLESHGIDRFLVNLGGDLVLGNPPIGKPGWRVSIDALEGEPLTVELANIAIATSGPRYQSLIVADIEHSHIIDPRLGEPLITPRGVTVLAASGTEADALASALSVLGEQAGPRLQAKFPGTQWRILSRVPTGHVHVWTSSGFPTPSAP